MPYLGKDFPPVAPVEEFDVGAEYINRFTFDGDEVIVSAVWAAKVDPASPADDAGAAGRKVGDANVLVSEISGRETATGQRFGGFVAGVTYRLVAVATTDRGQVLELWGRCLCVAAP